MPASLTTVCGSPSRFFQVTVDPALTVSAIGENMKALMTIWLGVSAQADSAPALAMTAANVTDAAPAASRNHPRRMKLFCMTDLQGADFAVTRRASRRRASR